MGCEKLRYVHDYICTFVYVRKQQSKPHTEFALNALSGIKSESPFLFPGSYFQD